MEVVLLTQIKVLFCASIFGGILGVIYTLFCMMREILSDSKIQIFFYDLTYFIFCGFLTFTFIFTFNYGEVRFYILAGELFGFIIYYISLGNYTIKMFMKLFSFLTYVNTKIKKFFISPINKLIRNICKKLTINYSKKQKKLNKLKINLKNKGRLVYNITMNLHCRTKHNGRRVR